MKLAEKSLKLVSRKTCVYLLLSLKFLITRINRFIVGHKVLSINPPIEAKINWHDRRRLSTKNEWPNAFAARRQLKPSNKSERDVKRNEEKSFSKRRSWKIRVCLSLLAMHCRFFHSRWLRTCREREDLFWSWPWGILRLTEFHFFRWDSAVKMKINCNWRQMKCFEWNEKLWKIFYFFSCVWQWSLIYRAN